MPPASRKPAAKKPDIVEDAEAVEVPKPSAAGEICRRCWPNGWPTEDTHRAHCEHGVWTR